MRHLIKNNELISNVHLKNSLSRTKVTKVSKVYYGLIHGIELFNAYAPTLFTQNHLRRDSELFIGGSHLPQLTTIVAISLPLNSQVSRTVKRPKHVGLVKWGLTG